MFNTAQFNSIQFNSTITQPVSSVAKSATLWKPETTGTAAPTNAGFFVILETGGNLLLETGDRMLLEDTVVTEKRSIAWRQDSISKAAALWKPTNTGSAAPTNTGFFLLLEDGGHLLLENGFRLLLENSVVTEKQSVDWREN